MQKAAAIEPGEGCINARHRAAEGYWVQMQWRVKSSNNRVVVLDLLVDGVHEQISPDSAAPSYSTRSQTLEQIVHIVESKNPGLLYSILLVDSMREHVIVGDGPSLAARKAGVAACWPHPISSTSGEILGAMARYCCEPKVPNQF